MDLTIRRNEHCVVGLPRCDYVFSSTRSCFIAYGFETSALETSILKRILEANGIEPVEAGGSRAPGQNAFCAKICSKILVSQFCIILLNNDRDASSGRPVPNPNVHMEYGLMLGFNKYVIPFQRRDEELPFNVAGLDTVKYDQADFERVATEAIEAALAATTPAPSAVLPTTEELSLFIIDEGYTLADAGDNEVANLGTPLGFFLLRDHGGTRYVFAGNFQHFRAESAIWRAKMLARSIDARRASWPRRIKAGLMTQEQADLVEEVFEDFGVWLLAADEDDRQAIERELEASGIVYEVRVITVADIQERIESLGHVIS